MPLGKKKQPSDEDRLNAGFYKGYDIRWLRKLGEEHPDFHLVAEFDRKFGKKSDR